MPDKICQKIVANLEIPFSLGRIDAQCAHASWISVLNQGFWDDNDNLIISCKDKPELKEWLKGQFTKVMLRGWGKEMLLNLKEQAESAGLPTGLMEEEGFVTALAIGPANTEKIDLAIGKLNLL